MYESGTSSLVTNQTPQFEEGSSSSIPFPSLSGKRQWVPRCQQELKPFLGMVFQTLDEGIEFYKSYDFACGFQTRFSGQRMRHNTIVRKYVLCNKEGFRDTREGNKEDDVEHSSIEDSKKRKRPITRVGCNAKIMFKLENDKTYKVATFIEEHTHKFYSPQSISILKSNLTVGHKHTIASNSKINIGPVTTFRAIKELLGGYQNIGASKNDFKNFQRDVKAFIGDSDAQMIIDILTKRNGNCKAFKFEYSVDNDGSLSRLFWADPIGQRNYVVFGDIMSFDTTYRSNKYNMVFCPFTGVDQHKSCVTFAAALLAKEDIESFVWLFEMFLKTMGSQQPTYLITDQDPAMEIAIKRVFTKATHRFCMWHIMKKISKEVPINICKDDLFSTMIQSCVWDQEIEPDEFENRWMTMINKFGLQENVWLTHKYHIRAMWIPAYFRDLYLGSILRTTSRSESENSFFGNFTNSFLSLVELWARFESAMDAQRHSQFILDRESKFSIPELKTPLAMEKHASEVIHTFHFL